MTPATNYLGKEQARNLFFYFSNAFFDDVWNRDHVQHIIMFHKQKY